MIDLTLPLIGPIVEKLAAVRELVATHDRLALLLHGDPGVAKSHALAQPITPPPMTTTSRVSLMGGCLPQASGGRHDS